MHTKDKEKAFDLLMDMIGSMRAVDCPVVPSPLPSESLFRWVHDWLAKDENMAAGQALTPLMWLPSNKWISVATCLKGELGYSAQEGCNLDLTVTLEATVPVRVLVGMRPIKYKQTIKVESGLAVPHDPGLYENLHQYKYLKEGETVTVAPHWAINALMAHSPLGYAPEYWDKGGIPQKEVLREVGYSFLKRTTDQYGADSTERVTAPKKTRVGKG